MTKGEVAVMNGAIDLGGGLTFNLTNEISSWDAFVGKARSFLVAKGVTSAQART